MRSGGFTVIVNKHVGRAKGIEYLLRKLPDSPPTSLPLIGRDGHGPQVALSRKLFWICVRIAVITNNRQNRSFGIDDPGDDTPSHLNGPQVDLFPRLCVYPKSRSP